MPMCPGPRARDQGRYTRPPGWDPNTWTDKGSPGHTVTKRPKIHRPLARSVSGDKAVVFQRARIGLELALIQKFDGSQNPISSRAGIDPNRPFKLSGANVRYLIAKRSFDSRSGRQLMARSGHWRTPGQYEVVNFWQREGVFCPMNEVAHHFPVRGRREGRYELCVVAV